MLDHSRTSASLKRGSQVGMPIEGLALQGDKQLPLGNTAGVGRDTHPLLPRQGKTSPLTVIEWHTLTLQFLIGFMPLAGQQHNIMRISCPEIGSTHVCTPVTNA